MAIYNAIIQWAIPFVLGTIITLIAALFVKFKAFKAGMRCLLRAEIISQYEKWGKRGYCPIYAKEALEKEYTAYHNLGGNDVATEMYEKVKKLPTDENTKGVTYEEHS